MQAWKKGMKEGSRGSVLMEDRNQALCVQAGYVEEGARAFIERRKPRFAERA